MIVLDTNVVSELMRPLPDEAVVFWLDAQQESDLYITSITQAELAFGIALMPDGKRKRALTSSFEDFLNRIFTNKILPFDSLAANHYAIIASTRQAKGKPISVLDAQIAALCMSTGASLATRNTRDFANIDITLVNPWEAHPRS
jgi:predicted nucleic acid-binding protein